MRKEMHRDEFKVEPIEVISQQVQLRCFGPLARIREKDWLEKYMKQEKLEKGKGGG